MGNRHYLLNMRIVEFFKRNESKRPDEKTSSKSNAITAAIKMSIIRCSSHSRCSSSVLSGYGTSIFRSQFLLHAIFVPFRVLNGYLRLYYIYLPFLKAIGLEIFRRSMNIFRHFLSSEGNRSRNEIDRSRFIFHMVFPMLFYSSERVLGLLTQTIDSM